MPRNGRIRLSSSLTSYMADSEGIFELEKSGSDIEMDVNDGFAAPRNVANSESGNAEAICIKN